MTPERWKQVENLYHEALQRETGERKLFLEQSQADPEIIQEVKSLLASHQNAGAFLAKPAAESAAQQLAEEQRKELMGRAIGSYRILSQLGFGGMGEVYLAHHERLDRKVALKFLPDFLQDDPTARKRFLREAKSAAALDHPFVCKIYELGAQENTSFIAMEYVPGENLRQRLDRDPIALPDALRIAREVAEGLDTAYQLGIVHRDLKPSNIMLTPQGHVKLMDFGLAKRLMRGKTGSQEETVTADLTEAGTSVGTPAYMSPEQLRGEAVDTRSDIFSFGIVLYEVLTRVHPFQRSHPIETAGAILRDDPPPIGDYLDDVPELLVHMLEKMLAKEAVSRYQSVHEVVTNLNTLTAGTQTAVRETGRSGKLVWISTSLAGAVAIVGIVAFLTRGTDFGNRVPRVMNPVRLTSGQGVEDHPAWSPAGDRLLYESNQNGNWDIWVKSAGRGDPVNLTADHPGSDRYPSWSPDGSQIAFLSLRDERWGLYAMAVGDSPRKLLSVPIDEFYYRGAPQWSADGSEIAVAVLESTRNYAQIISFRDRSTRRILLPRRKGVPALDLSWSPDGQAFAYVVADGDDAEVSRIWMVASSGDEPIAVTEGWTNDRNPLWSADGRELFFVSNRGGTMDLWQQRIGENGKPEGEPRPLTTGLVIRSAVFSPDGSRLAYSRGRHVSNVWRIPILEDRPARWEDAQQLTFDNALVEFIDVSPDGKQLAISSDREGNQDLWLLPSAGGAMSPLTTDDPTPDWGPRWSPDGEEIVFYSYRTGNRDLWIIPSEGGPARQLTVHPTEDAAPAWSPDGTEIAFSSFRAGNRDIWIVGAQGGEPRQASFEPEDTSVADWSPDGTWLVAIAQNQLFRVSAAGGQRDRLTSGPVGPFGARFSWDGKRLYYLREGNLWALSLEEGSKHSMTDLAAKRGTLGWGLATDGQYLYFTWAEETGDLWLMDVAKLAQ